MLTQIATMDSWNPFSSQFWTAHNLFGTSNTEDNQPVAANQPSTAPVSIAASPAQIELQEVKVVPANQSLLRKTLEDAIPMEFQDPITLVIPYDVFITIYGSFYDRTTLIEHWKFQSAVHTPLSDPLSRLPLDLSSELADEKNEHIQFVKNSLKTAHKKYTELSQLIDNADQASEEKCSEHIARFSQSLRDQLPHFQNALEILCRPHKIKIVKNRLKLDKDSTENLDFWHQPSIGYIHSKLSSCSRSPILFFTNSAQKGSHIIPKSIAALMETAAQDYKTTDDLLNSITQTIRTERSWFRDHFCCCTRNSNELKLMQSDSVESLRRGI